jgi:hypothetical protein
VKKYIDWDDVTWAAWIIIAMPGRYLPGAVNSCGGDRKPRRGGGAWRGTAALRWQCCAPARAAHPLPGRYQLQTHHRLANQQILYKGKTEAPRGRQEDRNLVARHYVCAKACRLMPRCRRGLAPY